MLDRSEPVIEWIIRICGWSAIIFVVAIFVFVFVEGAPALTEIRSRSFLPANIGGRPPWSASSMGFWR
jgi:ABC-type phosphate transport system permease subunit